MQPALEIIKLIEPNKTFTQCRQSENTHMFTQAIGRTMQLLYYNKWLRKYYRTLSNVMDVEFSGNRVKDKSTPRPAESVTLTPVHFSWLGHLSEGAGPGSPLISRLQAKVIKLTHSSYEWDSEERKVKCKHRLIFPSRSFGVRDRAKTARCTV